ncbi:MAG: hypothetical protein ACRELZ_18485 [Candidatus Rokuibacteriota bacterium]
MAATKESASADGRRYIVVGLLWLGFAFSLGATGRVATWRPPVPQLVLVGLTLLLLAAVVALPRFRRWLVTLDLRWLVAVHLTRFVGFYFLLLYYRDGALPRAFAVPGGWGDIAVATLAVGLLTLGGKLETWPRLVGTWNALGLLDILFVVATASRLAFAEPDSMSALLRLPLNLLVTFLVPLIIADHVVVFWRIAAGKRSRRP